MSATAVATRLSGFGLLVPALAAALALVGCGETVIDYVKAEEALAASLERSLHRRVAAASCPSGEKVETGREFECEVRFSDGERMVATLRIRNADADVSVINLRPR
jgi:uncharacterized protein DUF4333